MRQLTHDTLTPFGACTQVRRLACAVVVFAVCIGAYGCSSGPRTLKDSILDDLYPLMDHDHRRILASLTRDEQVPDFLEAFWKDLESEWGIPLEEFRSEYFRRLEFANSHYPDRLGWGRSDRKRIYLLHGPPDFIERFEDTDVQIGLSGTARAMEIWLYLEPEHQTALPTYLDDIFLGGKRFIFADMTGAGVLTLLHSSDDAADVDVRIMMTPY